MLKQVSPTFHVSDVRRSVSFYEDGLGFRCTFKLDEGGDAPIPYAIVDRDGVTIHLSASDPAGTSACYITVDDADGLWAEFQRSDVRVKRAIEDSDYGMRDFYIADVDGNELGFGQPIGGA